MEFPILIWQHLYILRQAKFISWFHVKLWYIHHWCIGDTTDDHKSSDCCLKRVIVLKCLYIGQCSIFIYWHVCLCICCDSQNKTLCNHTIINIFHTYQGWVGAIVHPALRLIMSFKMKRKLQEICQILMSWNATDLRRCHFLVTI